MSKTSLSQSDLDFMAFALENTPEGIVEEEENIEISPEEQAFAQQARKGPRPPKEVSRARSIVDAPLKGFYKIAGHALGAMPSGGQTYDETLEEIFPTQQERLVEGALQRGAEIGAGGGAAGGLPGILRSLLAGIFGEIVSRAPFIPESVKPYAEAVTEIGTLATPGELTKLPEFITSKLQKLPKAIRPSPVRIQPTAAQAPLVEEARRLGLSEAEIAPLIQDEKKVERLSKVAGKRFRTPKALKTSKKALDTALESLDTHPDIGKVLAPQQAESAIGNIEKKMFDKLTAKERGLIREDLDVLKASPKAAKDFVKFFRDVNKSITENPEARKSLNLLKDDIIDAVQKISPDLGNTFNVTNKLYSNYSKIFDKLRPNFQKDILQLGRHAILGMLAGHYPALVEIAGTESAKNLSREMLINPRFQNLGRQIVQAVNTERFAIANQLTQRLAKLVSKESPKVANQLESFDWESLEGTSEDEGADESS